jgi:hypothetical protein
MYVYSQNSILFFEYKSARYSKFAHVTKVYAYSEYVINYGCCVYFKYFRSLNVSLAGGLPFKEWKYLKYRQHP